MRKFRSKNIIKALTATTGALRVPVVAVCASLLIMPSVALAAVNINTASLSELMTLNGIGEVIGGRIIDARPFSSIADIKSVKGIGEATYKKIKGDITVGSVTVTDEEEDDNQDNNVTETASDSGGSSREEREPVEALRLLIPEYGLVGQVINMQVEPEEGTNDRLIRYSWNFGDANTGNGREVSHIYHHAGEYVVVVESYYLKETRIARQKIKIVEPELSVQRELNGDITLANNSAREISLTGMKLVGRKDFVFPSHSLLLPNASLTLSASAIDAVAGTVVSVFDQSGTLIASSYVAPVQEAVYTNKKAVASVPVETKEQSEEVIATSVPARIDSTNQAAAAGSSTLPDDTLPYLGLLAVVSIGIVGLYSTRL